MAVNSVRLTSALVMKVKTGVDGKGNDIFKSITFKRVKPGAVKEDVFAVAQGIASILAVPVSSVQRQDLDELINE
ncbi:hypothetical protein Q428_15380 [Fervidicella metallireducens AeB]|uniref:DUF1659 domain-containing protein n=1 Tax=Fervidicella metallireducens AeB TaxID=1403537 RepID=A0A017RT96_9CLOT|nr:DUF1659 domain-containing protein [Fervidicella metallireducens]EYE87095.1 hypothetical protein Q428_15380 [Fervidicella metallireducens AeB]